MGSQPSRVGVGGAVRFPPLRSTAGSLATGAACGQSRTSNRTDDQRFRDAATAGFAERFAAGGTRDRKGRSLYELDLTRRLFKYPCSYLIYSATFNALPAGMKGPIYQRMWQVLSGQESGPRYRHALTLADNPRERAFLTARLPVNAP